MNKHVKRLGIAGLVALCVVGIAHARGPSPGSPGGTATPFGGTLRAVLAGHRQQLQGLRSELNLSDDQRQQIRQIVVAHRSEIAVVAQPLIAKGRALREAMNASSLDETAIRTASAELTQSIGDAAILATKIKAEIRPILSTEQAAKLLEMRSVGENAVDELINKLGQP